MFMRNYTLLPIISYLFSYFEYEIFYYYDLDDIWIKKVVKKLIFLIFLWYICIINNIFNL